MDRFSTPNNKLRETAKKKVFEVRETHGAPPKETGKRPLLGFTDK